MVRIVRAPDGAVTVDPTGKRSGRGAYLCLQQPCWQAALKRHALDKALKTELSVADRAALAAFGASQPASLASSTDDTVAVVAGDERQDRGI
jgi:predicted RNA-binding protein YlxR (DUF448 family)